MKVFGDFRDYHLDYPLAQAGFRLNQGQATHGLYVLIQNIVEVPHLVYVSRDAAAHLTYLCNAFEACIRVQQNDKLLEDDGCADEQSAVQICLLAVRENDRGPFLIWPEDVAVDLAGEGEIVRADQREVSIQHWVLV
jgi:phosphotransferase system HPr-like phosphotransfer protein